jgi:hypothetical protein
LAFFCPFLSRFCPKTAQNRAKIKVTLPLRCKSSFPTCPSIGIGVPETANQPAENSNHQKTTCHPEQPDSLPRVTAAMNCRQLANSLFPRSGSQLADFVHKTFRSTFLCIRSERGSERFFSSGVVSEESAFILLRILQRNSGAGHQAE